MTPATRQAKRQTKRDPLKTRSGREVLAAFARYHYLSSAQVTALLYSRRLSGDTLTALTRAGYLTDENWLDRGPLDGRAPRVWSLTQRGRLALTSLDVPIPVRIHHSPDRAQLFLRHTEAINDCLIAGEKLARITPGVELIGMAHDQELQRRPVKVALPDNAKGIVVLDGFLAFEIDGESRVCFGLEVDRGTEQQDKWREKVRKLVAFASGNPSPFETAFGFPTDGLSIAVYIRAKDKRHERRLEELLRWTEAELTLLKIPAWGAFFRMTALDPRDLGPANFFGTDHWRAPFTRGVGPLIGGLV